MTIVFPLSAAVTKTVDGVKVLTTSDGLGNTDGAAGVIQNVAANGGFNAFDSLKVNLPGLSIDGENKASGTSSTGHKASSAGLGEFTVQNKAGTEIKLKAPKLDLDAIPLPKLPPPVTTAKPTTQRPKYKKGKW